jgi:2-polyprenyl-6-methoxyphenol hydroxylase-like FAD-dependent oxidoreductase
MLDSPCQGSRTRLTPPISTSVPSTPTAALRAAAAVRDDRDRRHARAAGGRSATLTQTSSGCDGAHSIVRRRLGVAFDGDDDGQDGRSAARLVAGQRPLSRVRLAPAVLPVFPLPGGRWRLFLPEVPNRSAHQRRAPDMEEINRLVAARGPAGMTVSEPSLLAAFRCYRRATRPSAAGVR